MDDIQFLLKHKDEIHQPIQLAFDALNYKPFEYFDVHLQS
jgi:hypothetical protein